MNNLSSSNILLFVSSSISVISASIETTTPLPIIDFTLSRSMPDGIRCKTNFDDHDVVCFNGHASTMAKRGWWQEYTQPIKPYWESAEI